MLFLSITSVMNVIHCMRDLEVVGHQTRWLPLEDKVLPSLLVSAKASAMVSYKRFRRVQGGFEMRPVYVTIYRPFHYPFTTRAILPKAVSRLQHRGEHD
jgi:hypothetical protein